MYDFLFHGGTVVDPSQGINRVTSVAVSRNRIAAVGDIAPENAVTVIDASGYFLFPGLIDFHVHAYWGGTDTGCPVEISCIPNGVTSAVDAGSAGTANFRNFSTIMHHSHVRMKAQINLSPIGIATKKFYESVNPEHFDKEKLALYLQEFGNQIIGIKMRIGRPSLQDMGIAPLRAAADIAHDMGLPLVIHTTKQPLAVEEVLAVLEPGDVYAHVHQGADNNILDENGHVRRAVRQAQERGILFDAARGVQNSEFRIIRAALDDGFLPDIISSDVSYRSLCEDPGYSLPYALSCFLNLGLSLSEVIERCTILPAKLMGMEGLTGTLRPGAFADIAMFEYLESPCEFYDAAKQALRGNIRLVPKLTMKDGKILYRTLDSLSPQRTILLRKEKADMS